MTEDSRAPAANHMLGSQLVSKSIIRSPPPTSKSKQTPPAKQTQPKQQQHPPSGTPEVIAPRDDQKSPTRAAPTSQTTQTQTPPKTLPITKPQEHHPTQIPKSKRSPELKQNVSLIETSINDDGQQQAATTTISSDAKELQLITKEVQDLKAKTRKLQLEVDEKNEIINVLKDELETLREQNDKYHRDSIQLIKDSKRVKFLQDENDFLQDKVGQVEILELEIKRLKERLNETDFFKLRVSELEEDLNKTREESNQFEDKWHEAESKLTRVAELESELNKWKSFSHELEQEKNSIQSKLLDSIDHEAKLDSDNKKVEAEVRRLRDMIKSIEEQRDEEQASNSLIMSVADLKQLDSQNQQVDETSVSEVGTNTELICSHEIGQQTDICDTAEISCETDHSDLLKLEQEHKDKDDNIVALKNENDSLKEELRAQGQKLNNLADSNKQISSEINGNRRLISDLRQDLACEKSLTQKLTTQLTSFTKQIKSLDKQYFPIHDTTTSTSKAKAPQHQQLADQSKLIEKVDCEEKIAATAVPPPPTHTKDGAPATLTRTVDGTTDVSSKISTPDHHFNGSKKELPPSSTDESSQEHLAKKGVASLNPSANSMLNVNGIAKTGTEKMADDKLTRISAKSNRSSERDNRGSNFVRNAMPSRSVNFGHSKSSSQLERIRASVTATATTSSSNTSATSFNERTANNIVLNSAEQPPATGNGLLKPGFVLNCMLNHHHSDRCFATIERPTRIQVSQPVSTNVMHTNPILHTHNQYQQVGNHQVIHNHHQGASNAGGVSTSRQLNALIDPVANEQLLMGVLQQQLIAQQQQSGLPSAPQLTEQQIAHLNNLQRQHYFHHLHQLHQMHHLHQLHHLHHNCQQQQQNRNQQTEKAEKTINANDLSTGMMGSQFYASNYDQVYANMATNNNNLATDHKGVRQNGNRLVKNDSDPLASAVSHEQDYKRSSPQRNAPPISVYHHQLSNTKLAQIDELSNNGPMSFDTRGARKINSATKQQAHPLLLPDSSPKSSKHLNNSSNNNNNVTNGASSHRRQQQTSPTLSSPTSSRTSSNISPSSEVSSSSSTSSTNSLTTSVPLTRSALRHTSTDLGKRQYSVEREIVNSTPLIATLSRVGSCRGAMGNNFKLSDQHQTTVPPKDMSLLMRNPVQSQQPPMRTSKILNIGSQQQANVVSTATTGGIADSSHSKPCKMTPNDASSIVDNFSRSTVNNMANIRLNDNLAFASLRVPKKSSSGSNLNTSLIAAAAASRNGRSINSKVSSASSSPDKVRLIKAAHTNSTGKSNNTGSNSNNNGHSSVWYEYGCI